MPWTHGERYRDSDEATAANVEEAGEESGEIRSCADGVCTR